MPIVRVVKQFILQTDDGKRTNYIPGTYDVPDEIAEHWYFKCHLEGYVEPPPPDGTHQYAQRMLFAEQAVRMGERPEDQGQKPAELPPGTETARPVHYFAGEEIKHPEGPAWLTGRPS